MLSPKPSFSWENETNKSDTPLPDHVEKENIEMKCIETERQLTDIFTKPLDVAHFASLQGELDVCHPYDMV
jgi:hypothetical protein